MKHNFYFANNTVGPDYKSAYEDTGSALTEARDEIDRLNKKIKDLEDALERQRDDEEDSWFGAKVIVEHDSEGDCFYLYDEVNNVYLDQWGESWYKKDIVNPVEVVIDADGNPVQAHKIAVEYAINEEANLVERIVSYLEDSGYGFAARSVHEKF